MTAFGALSAPREDWLGKAAAEPIMDPDLPVIDTHHHLWPGSTSRVGSRYELDEYLQDTGTGHRVTASVFVSAKAAYRGYGPAQLRPVGETEWVAGVAAASESGEFGPTQVGAAIVSYVDLTAGDWVAPALETHLALGGGRFRGVRDSAAWDPDPSIGLLGTDGPGRYLRDDFRAGLRRLAGYGLSLDAWGFFHQVPEITDLARTFPDATIVLCHLGGPLGYGPYAGRGDEVFAQWREAMAGLAQCENVSVKLGGVMMRLASFPYSEMEAPPTARMLADAWGPYIRTCIDLFGPSRCMVESNFPVDKMGIGFAALFNGYKLAIADLSLEERRQVLSGTAERVYRIDPGLKHRS